MAPPGLRRLQPDARRAQLLDAAITLAAGRDVGAISVADLAAAAGVSEGLLYHYFPTKQALVVAAVRRAADDLLVELEAATGATPVERLISGLSAYLDHVEARPTGWLALLKATTGELAEVAAVVDHRSRALILDVIGVETPGPGLAIAISGWEALERAACAAWLEQDRALPRRVLESMLAAAFFASVEAAAAEDPTAADALHRLTT